MKKTRLHDFLQSVSQARGIIAQNGNRIKLICLLLLLSAFVLLCALLTSAFSLFWNSIPLAESVQSVLLGACYVLPLLFLSLFFLPQLFHGILAVAYRMRQYEDVPLSAVFCVFSNNALYWRCVAWAFELLWRVLSVASVVLLTYYGFASAFSGSLLAGICCALLILLELALGFFWCGRRFGLLFFLLRDERMSLRSAQKEQQALLKHSPFAAFRYFASFLPHLLLGILTVGVYLLADVLPRMLLTYICECENTYESMIQLEENKNHE